MKLRLKSHPDRVLSASLALLGNVPDMALTAGGVVGHCISPGQVDLMCANLTVVHAGLGVSSTLIGTRKDSIRSSVFAAAEYAKVVGYAALSTHPAIGAAINGAAILVQVGLSLSAKKSN